MPLIILLPILRRDQRRREFHFRITSPQADRFFHPRVTTQPRRRIHPIPAIYGAARHPKRHLQLPVSFDQVSIIESRRRVVFAARSARLQSGKQLPSHRLIILTIKRRPPNRLHPHQHRRIRSQQRQSVRNQMANVVVFVAGKLPTRASPRQRTRRTYVDRMANQRRPREHRRGKQRARRKNPDRILHRTKNVTFHLRRLLAGSSTVLHLARRANRACCQQPKNPAAKVLAAIILRRAVALSIPSSHVPTRVCPTTGPGPRRPPHSAASLQRVEAAAPPADRKAALDRPHPPTGKGSAK